MPDAVNESGAKVGAVSPDSTGKERDHESLVPAISRAVRAISVLLDAPDGETLSVIATRAGVSKSTASNLLRTMAHEGLLSFDPDTRRYQLGPVLIELGAVAVGRTPPIVQARRHMERLAEETRLACLAIRRMHDGHFLAVDKIESRKDIKITIEVGERFAPDSPVLSRLWDVWGDGGPIEAPRRRYTAATVTDPDALEEAERAIREQGFATVYGEYMPNVNVVAVPVFDKEARPALTVAMLGVGDDLSPDEVAPLAPMLVQAARDITLASGGRLPAGYP